MHVGTFHSSIFFFEFVGVGSFADVVFAVDRSIKEHALVKISSLLMGAVDQYTISPTNTRVALVQFSKDLDILHRMSIVDRTVLLQKLSLLSFSKDHRDIPNALKDISSTVFAKPARPGAKLKIFMFVAGPTDHLDQSKVNAAAEELKKNKIEVQFVYIGDHSGKSLLPFVKSENDIMHVASPNEIPFALDPILKMNGVKQGRIFFTFMVTTVACSLAYRRPLNGGGGGVV